MSMRAKDNARASLAMSHSRRGAAPGPVATLPLQGNGHATRSSTAKDDGGDRRLLLRVMTTLNGMMEKLNAMSDEISEIRSRLAGSDTATEPGEMEDSEKPEPSARGGK